MRQLVESLANPREFFIVANYISRTGGEGGKLEPPSPFDCESIPYMIDDESAHDPRCIGHEAAPIRERLAPLRGHVKVSLVYEGGSTEGYNALARELAPGQPTEFPVENGKKLARRNLVTLFRQVNQRRDVRVSPHGFLNTASRVSKQ
jgi:hypothetical protein